MSAAADANKEMESCMASEDGETLSRDTTARKPGCTAIARAYEATATFVEATAAFVME